MIGKNIKGIKFLYEKKYSPNSVSGCNVLRSHLGVWVVRGSVFCSF